PHRGSPSGLSGRTLWHRTQPGQQEGEEDAMKAEAAIATGANAATVVETLVAQLPMLQDSPGIDLAFLFTSDAYAGDLPGLLPELKARLGARVIVGCSGQGLIGPGKEEEQLAAMSLQVLSLPGATL